MQKSEYPVAFLDESEPVPDNDLPDGIESVNIDDWEADDYLDSFVSDILETGFAD